MTDELPPADPRWRTIDPDALVNEVRRLASENSQLRQEMARVAQRSAPDPSAIARVKIVSVDIGFGDMIGLILQFSIALIPAAIVLGLAAAFLAAMLFGLGKH